MMDQSNEQNRPVLLTVLCVLTFISSSMGGISALFTAAFNEMLVEFVANNSFIEEADKTTLLKIINAGAVYHLSLLIFYTGSFLGAIYMWQLRKIGFHLYAISNLALLFMPTLFLGMLVGLSGVLMTLAFIGLYAVYLKLMK